jgi:hypothetical protein
VALGLDWAGLDWPGLPRLAAHLKTMGALRNPAACLEPRTKSSDLVLLTRTTGRRLQSSQTALCGKGQKACYKLCFQRSALLSKKLASKVLIGPSKINPFNE